VSAVIRKLPRSLEIMQYKFQGYNVFLKQLRTDKGWRVEIDVSQEQYDAIKDLPKLEDQILDITIEDKG
jgi:hypothetical protein